MEKYSPQYLIELLSKIIAPQQEVPLTELKYVVYVRKSSKGEEKQERSIQDQTDECREFAQKQNLRIKDVIQEQESAKDSGQRPKFNQMLTDIKNRKYDGIISWHPDRLARNMKEAGEIIDLLDKKVIKDLKFPSFSFYNDVDGKVLLGISFVLAKQYSEKLGKDIKRGVDKSVLEGKLPAQTKYGYYKDKATNRLYPDGNNFVIIKKAWDLKVEGKVNKEIADYINQCGFYKAVGRGNDTHKKYLFTENKLSEMFRNPFYAGVHKYGGSLVDLFSIYDFKPVISVEDFLKINNQLHDSEKEKLRKTRRGAILGGYLSKMVKCNSCGKYLRVAPTTKPSRAGNPIIYLRCMTEGCEKRNASARARVIDGFIQVFLESSDWLTTRSAHQKYLSEMQKYVENKNKELSSDKVVLMNKRTNLKDRVNKLKDSYISEKDEIFKKELKADLDDTKESLNNTLNEIDKLSEKIRENKNSILEFSEFYELFKNLPLLSTKLKKLKNKDQLARILFTNLTVELKKGDSLNSKVVDFELNSPFKELYNTQEISIGGAGGNRTHVRK